MKQCYNGFMNGKLREIYSEQELDKIHKPSEDRYRGLLEICEDMVGYIKGSSDGAFYGYNTLDLIRESEYLQKVVKFWTPTKDFYDLAVLNLIEATILRAKLFNDGYRF